VASAILPIPPQERLTEEEAAEWGRALGAALPRGAVVALHGELGAGKTTLVRALSEGLGVHDVSGVTSPTFAIMQEYETARGAVLHADWYRLRRAEELDQLGWDELVASARATLVEWPERAEERLPADVVHVWLAHVVDAPEVRSIRLAGPITA
jgi:tRNA threonylcarbamoyl adenosine modification protein YjeE